MSASPAYLTCAHCGAEFIGTRARYKRHRAGKNVCCSDACAHALVGATHRTPVPVRGPCPTCGKQFESRIEKKFCSMDCYMTSPEYGKQLREANAGRVRRAGGNPDTGGHECICLHCGKTWRVSRLLKMRKFCSREHQRLHYAERFDRWIAAPGRIALPQAFDEFLTQEELPCLVDGCDWVGHNLSYHMNVTHGVQARDFKRAAGFNLKSGIISLPLQRIMREWQRSPNLIPMAPGGILVTPEVRRYRSLEGKEHVAKGRAVAEASLPRERVRCPECGEEFERPIRPRPRLLCSGNCVQRAARKTRKTRTLTCGQCGATFQSGDTRQERRFDAGLFVACSTHCRQIHNSRTRSAGSRRQP